MRLEHTPGLAIALRRAWRFAEAEGFTALEPAHLLRGLLAEEEGHGAALLRQAGLDLPAWRRSAGAANDAAAPSDLEEAELRVTAAVRHIFNLAREEISAIAEEGSLATDQVLLALLADCEDLRRQLESQGLDYEALRRTATDQGPPLTLETPLLFESPTEPIDTARMVDASAN